MAVPLADHLEELAAEFLAAPRVLICSDFDGTLVPIRDRPEHCSLDPAIGRALSELCKRETIRVGIVSGRELAELRARVGLEGLAYAGNHGLQIDTPVGAFRHPVAVASRSSLERLIHDLRRELSPVAGVWVEDKELSASVHYRQAEPSRVPQVFETVGRVLAGAVDSAAFVLRPGKAVFELRPAVDWNKGSAVHWLAEHCFPASEPPLVIYLGDDDTDEDVFRVLGNGVSICVGDRPATAAKYSVPDHHAVHRIFDWFIAIAHDREYLLNHPHGQPT